MSAHYPEAGHSAQSLKVIADDFFQEFTSWSQEEFFIACKEHLRIGRFFPKIADLMAIGRLPTRTEGANLLEAPEDFPEVSPEQAARNKQCAEIFSKAAGGIITFLEATEMIEQELRTPIPGMGK